jgi:hypothetical protein
MVLGNALVSTRWTVRQAANRDLTGRACSDLLVIQRVTRLCVPPLLRHDRERLDSFPGGRQGPGLHNGRPWDVRALASRARRRQAPTDQRERPLAAPLTCRISNNERRAPPTAASFRSGLWAHPHLAVRQRTSRVARDPDASGERQGDAAVRARGHRFSPLPGTAHSAQIQPVESATRDPAQTHTAAGLNSPDNSTAILAPTSREVIAP